MVERGLSFRVRRFLVLVLVVMFTLGPIGRAYADDYEGGGGASQSFNSSFGTVWYGPTASGLYVRYGVVANTRYDAAVYCCRGRSFDLNDLSATKKSKLLNNGDFRQFAELFNASKPELTDDWSGDAAIVQAWNSARQLYGETYCWNARYTNDQKIRAQEAIEDVLNDDDTPSGGGTGGGGVNVPVQDTSGWYKVTLRAENEPYSGSDAYKGIKVYDNPTVTLDSSTGMGTITGGDEEEEQISWNDTETFTGYVDPYTYNLVKDSEYTIDNYCKSFDSAYVIASNTDKYEWVKKTTDSNYAIKNVSDGKLYLKTYTSASKSFYRYNGELCVFFTSATYSKSYSASSGSTTSGNWKAFWYSLYAVESPPPVEPDPPIDWPTPPTEVPTPPEVPTPGDPTQPTPPDPVTPTPGNPWIPIPDEDISITGEDFQDLIDALNEHCIHLQNSIQSNVSQLWDLQSDFLGTQFSDLFGQISDNFTWLGNDVITESFNDLKSYLHELFEWLSEQLNFDVTVEGGQYDDTSVLYWLKQIWAKLPTGINTRPTDPVTNPDGWWDWLTQLLNNLAADLMMLGQDRLAGVLETLNQLRSKFPFSLPWDVAALLGLLVGVPECPEFDMPCYTVTLQGLQEVGTYHITLEPYETVWEGVKWMETLAFSVYLIMNTSGLMDMVSKTVRPR